VDARSKNEGKTKLNAKLYSKEEHNFSWRKRKELQTIQYFKTAVHYDY
jgi:hypothetical protein